MESLDLIHYIKPELFVVMAIIYFIGMMMKQAEIIRDKYIPLVLSLVSFGICLLYFLYTMPLFNANAVLEAIFASLIQGILIVACTVYGNQMLKQLKKEE